MSEGGPTGGILIKLRDNKLILPVAIVLLIFLLVALPFAFIALSTFGGGQGDLGTTGLAGLGGGGTTDCSQLKTVSVLDGHPIPASIGKFGIEQHLVYNSEIEQHYSQHAAFGVPAVKNGAAGGYGAFAGHQPVPIAHEAWYSNMRWQYVSTAWNGNVKPAPNMNSLIKWYKSKKVVIKFNGKCIATSVEEFGPAPYSGSGRKADNPPSNWTGFLPSDPPGYNGRVIGASAEVARALGLSTNNVVEIGWAADQSVPLGVVSQGTSTQGQTANQQGTVLPLRTSDMTNQFNSSLHNCSVSKPGRCSDKDKGHRAALGSLGPAGTNIPHVPNSGEAADIQAKPNSPVFAPFSGKITKRGLVDPTKPSIGSQLYLQSTDGRMAAALLHLNNASLIQSNTVKAGEQVGTLIPMTSGYGNTHLHFELWINGKVINAGGPGSGVTGKKIWEAQKQALGY